MENLRRWINYDWFKLIVALILLVIFIALMLRTPAPNAVAGSSVSTAPAATATSPVVPAAASTATQPAAPAASPTAPPPTATAAANAAPTATVPPPTATAQPEATQAPSPTPAAAATATPKAQQPAQTTASGDCSKALPTRLDVGKKAQVAFDLNLRAEPGMDKKITFTNPPGARLEIIGGPVCIPYGSGTYRWWNVKMTNGTTGWSAEGSLAGKRYFLEPLP